MTPLDKARAGYPVTLLDKLETVSSAAEMQGFVWQLKRSNQELSDEERAAIARKKAELERGKWTRNS